MECGVVGCTWRGVALLGRRCSPLLAHPAHGAFKCVRRVHTPFSHSQLMVSDGWVAAPPPPPPSVIVAVLP